MYEKKVRKNGRNKWWWNEEVRKNVLQNWAGRTQNIQKMRNQTKTVIAKAMKMETERKWKNYVRNQIRFSNS